MCVCVVCVYVVCVCVVCACVWCACVVCVRACVVCVCVWREDVGNWKYKICGYLLTILRAPLLADIMLYLKKK